MATATANFPGRPFRLRVEASINWQSGSIASVHREMWIDKLSYSPTFSNAGTSSWQMATNGVVDASWGPGNFDFRNGSNFLLHSQDYMANVQNNGQIPVSGFANFDILGYTEAGAVIQGTPLSPPPPPSMRQPDQITTTGMRVQFDSTGDGGSPVTSWGLQRATDPGFTQNVVFVGSTGTTVFNDLAPGTTYYFRARGGNAIGVGGFSSAVAASTLPATPPGVTITPWVSGQAVTMNVTPPSNASGVTKYSVQWRAVGGSTNGFDMTGTSVDIGTLNPGGAYEFRASAWFGSYQSPWSDWVQQVMPNPNTQPGEYFDGSTPARGDVTFQWTGTVGNSISQAMGVGVQGWLAAVTAPLTAVLSRVTGGMFGAYSARADVITDGNAAGQLRVGLNAADTTARVPVEESTMYVGSIYVNPSRSQRMAARLYWMNAAGAGAGTPIAGDGVVCPAGQWTRLSVATFVPAGAGVETAVVQAIDVAGTGWSAWQSGQSVRVDGAMVSLALLFDWFSGDTPDNAQYRFEWEGTPNASASARYENTATVVDPLADPDCPPLPAPPTLPTIESDCIDEAGTWRRYSLTIPASEVRLWSSTLPTLVLATQSSAERQVRIRYYPNPAGSTPEAVVQEGWEAEQILTYIPPNTEITLDGVIQRVSASVAGAAPIPANRLLYGTGGVPATWPELRCGVGYVVTLDVPLDAPAGNLTSRVIVTQRM